MLDPKIGVIYYAIRGIEFKFGNLEAGLTSELEGFLGNKDNSRSKEALVNHRLLYDLKLAAAIRGYDLSLYCPDVDRDGFDLILDDRDLVIRIQLKTVLSSAATKSWDIHKRMLRPEARLCEQLGFEPTQSGVGMQGGVILIELEPSSDEMSVTYHYTDVFVVTALYLELVQKTPKIQSRVFDSFYKKIRCGKATEKIEVAKSLFVEAKGPEHLLGLMSLHNRINYGWWHHLISIGEDRFLRPIDDQKLPAPKRVLRQEIADQLLELTNGLKK